MAPNDLKITADPERNQRKAYRRWLRSRGYQTGWGKPRKRPEKKKPEVVEVNG